MRVIARTAAVAVAVLAGVSCSTPSAPSQTLTGGDADRGAAAIDRYGCAACHDIPGIDRAETSWVGPPLTKFSRRSYIAGRIVNSEENLIRWIMDPKSIDPRTAMPDLDVTELEARDITAYLYSLR